MSIKSELEKTASYLRETRQAIVDKGGEISSTAGLKDVPSAINTIPDILTDLIRERGGVSMFSNYKTIKDADLMAIMPAINNANLTALNRAFMGCAALTEIPKCNSSNVTNMSMMLQDCSALETVHGFDLRNCTNTTRCVNGCPNLKNLVFTNIKASLTLSYNNIDADNAFGHYLTVDSLIGVIYELRDTGKSVTLTINETNLDKLANVYVKLIDITDEMRAEDEFIDEKLPFVVCESTDEGATLITDYVLFKNWKLA